MAGDVAGETCQAETPATWRGRRAVGLQGRCIPGQVERSSFIAGHSKDCAEPIPESSWRSQSRSHDEVAPRSKHSYDKPGRTQQIVNQFGDNFKELGNEMQLRFKIYDQNGTRALPQRLKRQLNQIREGSFAKPFWRSWGMLQVC